ncbi:MAG: choice-of-anchor D domain-containing protein [Acidimicrobiales bacterium]
MVVLGALGIPLVANIASASAASSLSPIATGDIIASLASGQVNEYTPAGNLVQTLMTATSPTGMAFDAQGNLYVTDFASNDILKLDAKTMTVSVFSNDTILNDGTTYNSPESIAFGPGYTKMYVSDADRNGPGGGIHVVNPATGAGEGFYPLPSSQGSDGTGESDWLAFDHSGSLFMTNENAAQGIMRVDQATGDIVQPSFVANTSGGTPYALSFDQNGNVWLGDTSSIDEYSPTGTLLNSITNPNFNTVFAAAFNPVGNTFYAGDLSTGEIYTYDLAGALQSSFNAGSGIDGLAVAGSTLVPTTPAAVPTPSSLSFGSQPVGTPTAAQTVTLHSSGTANLVLSSAPTVSGTDAGDFQLSGNTCTAGLALAPSASCTVSVAFDPTASGSRSATLNFSDNATSSPQQVTLTGTGTSSGPPPPPHPARGTCSGSFAVPGVLSGVHTGNVTVKGYCIVDGGPTVITGDLTLAKGAALNATFARNDVSGSGTSSLLVEGDLRVGTGAALDMGCEPKYSPCSDDPTATIGPHGPTGGTLTGQNRVDGSLVARNALGVVVHASTIKGSVFQLRGGGGLSCAPPSAGLFSVLHSPVFSDYENNDIVGNLTVSGLRSCYFGALRNRVHQNLNFNHNMFGDPDSSEVVSNIVGQDLRCANNAPAAQYGDSTARPNRVGDHATGECGFTVLQPRPAPHGPLTHISIRRP